MGDRDWVDWHTKYDDAGTSLSWRLGVIQERIRETLDGRPKGPIRVISICAGQGRDIIGALAGHPRRIDVTARLVELDPRNVAHSQELLAEAGLSGIELVNGDASTTTAYSGAVPADLVLVCGVFGNLRDSDVRNTIRHLSTLCADNATVIWTRHRIAPDLTPSIRSWFAEAGYRELSFDASPEGPEGVGVHQLASDPDDFREGIKFFEFVGFDKLLNR